MNFAVVGTGWISKSLINASEISGTMKLSAVYSRNKETAEQFLSDIENKNEIKIYTDLNELANDKKNDAVYIASPNIFHFPQSKLFLSSGKHVLCEKPAVINSVDLKELFRIAQKNNVCFMEAMKSRHTPARHSIKDAMKKIGKIHSAQLNYFQFSSRYLSIAEGEPPNVFNPKMGAGSLMDLGCYPLSAAIDFFGRPTEITAKSGFLSTGADGFGSIILTFDDVIVSVSYSKIGHSYAASEIFGDKGTIVIGSSSQLKNSKIVYHDNTEEFIYGEEDFDTVMSWEVTDFVKIASDISGNRQEYSEISQHSQLLCEVLEEIRLQIGLKLG